MAQVEDKRMVDPTEIKKMDIKEFRLSGYFQEVNRIILNPLGLALEIKINKDGTESLSGIWDHREDPEGIYFALNKEAPNSERLKSFREKACSVMTELNKRNPARIDKLGYVIEPIPESVE